MINTHQKVIAIKAPEAVVQEIKNGRCYVSTKRDVKIVVGDKVVIQALDDNGLKNGYYITRRVTAIDKNKPWIAEGYTIISIK